MNKNISSLKRPTTWQCASESVRGAAHLRANLPNQDAIKLFSQSGSGLPTILAVSDGHGSAKSFRSHKGSLLAVEIAVEVIKELFLDGSFSDRNFSMLETVASELLPQRIAHEWKKAVNRDLDLPEDCPINQKGLACRPNFTDEEYQILIQKEDAKAWQTVENNHFIAYGATLLSVLVTERFIIYLQLGDGDILQVDTEGNTTWPLTPDNRLIANQTTSLCMVRAEDEFRVCVEQYSPSMRIRARRQVPALILAATDGYANSFSTNEGFSKIGQDYRQMFKESSNNDIRQQLKAILQETSEKGSGDDITLGLIKRIEDDDWDRSQSWSIWNPLLPLRRRVMLPDKNRRTSERWQAGSSKSDRLLRWFAIPFNAKYKEKAVIAFAAISVTALSLTFIYIAFVRHLFPFAHKVEKVLPSIHFLYIYTSAVCLF